MKAKEEENKWELEAVEAELNYEESEYQAAITKAIDEEYTDSLQDTHKELLEQVS